MSNLYTIRRVYISHLSAVRVVIVARNARSPFTRSPCNGERRTAAARALQYDVAYDAYSYRVMITRSCLYISVVRGAHTGTPQIHKLPALTLINAHFSLFPAIDRVRPLGLENGRVLASLSPSSSLSLSFHIVDYRRKPGKVRLTSILKAFFNLL